MEKYIKIILALIFVLLIVLIGIHSRDFYIEFKDYSYALEYENLGNKMETGKDSYAYSETIKLPKKEYREGDILKYPLSFCKNVPEGARLVGVLQDGASYLYPTVRSDVEEGCYEFEEATYIIPKVGEDGIPTGTYRLIKRVVYTPNGTNRDITFTIKTEDFEIQ